jgi:hypothetical protein
MVDAVIESITRVASTGKIGDGKILSRIWNKSSVFVQVKLVQMLSNLAQSLLSKRITHKIRLGDTNEKNALALSLSGAFRWFCCLGRRSCINTYTNRTNEHVVTTEAPAATATVVAPAEPAAPAAANQN